MSTSRELVEEMKEMLAKRTPEECHHCEGTGIDWKDNRNCLECYGSGNSDEGFDIDCLTAWLAKLESSLQ